MAFTDISPEGSLSSAEASGSTKNESRIGKYQIVWKNAAAFFILHSIFLYAIFLMFTFRVGLRTILFTILYGSFHVLGVTGGAHRLWSHRSYKANLPLRIFLMLAQTAALQNDILEWARDHRVHHKFTDTDADPHNASRGFFFSHIGWLMCKKHPDVIAKGKKIDVSDISNDPVVKFQRKFYIPLILLMNVAVPTFIPWYFFGEHLSTSFIMSVWRYVFTLNGTWSINSAAHIWGMRPFDKTIKPTDNKMLSVLAFGEAWHNYHHIFPWDYKAAELGNYRYNFTTGFLDLMAKIGWATDLKTTNPEVIRQRALRSGDNSWSRPNEDDSTDSYHGHHHHGENLVWGWGDKDMKQNDINAVKREKA